MTFTTETWQSKAAAKKAAILASIPEEWRLSPSQLKLAEGVRDITGPFIQQFLDHDTIAITSLDSVPIVEAIKSGKLSAVEVTKAFCKTAAIAHQINPCILEIFFDKALARAQELDDYQAKHGRTMGPLHGLPVSLKDQFHVKGVDTSMAYVGWIGGNCGVFDDGLVHKIESQITGEFLSVGAVLYCKTSLPQTVFFGETVNHILGTTYNPHNRNLSCGGSSGGEAVLHALRGSTLGVGTDIGGSVRIPAGFCGTFSLKPTPERLSYKDCANTAPGQYTCRSTIGLMGTSLDGVDLGLRALLSTQPWIKDPAVVPIPYRQDIYDAYLARGSAAGAKPLKIGVVWNDGMVEPHPPVQRGLKLLAEAVKNAGHKIVDWNPPSVKEGCDIHRRMLLSDGLYDIHQQLARSGEPLVPSLTEELKQREPRPLLEVHDLTLKGLAYEIKYSDYWNSTADDDGQVVDAVIMPVAASAAVVPGQYYHIEYTRVANALNYSSVVIPVTKADKSVDTADKTYQPIDELDRKNWEAYDPEIYDGAPVGLQIMGRKYEEEKVLAIAKVVYAALLEEKKGVKAAL
ncbi:amidase [Coniochaeta ligniaria NRRL 30616]|uniref:Amidase n=1 Tax=Coniochaeta ligniaria NRRL 30616 TaxID=1408157 RepID=A0A1J7ITH2_9PEZI|nr:amidase [Coniochaeta ligniaria NRRL 30616]